MPEFLTSSHLNSKIESIIDNAQDNLFLISPYIKFSPPIKRRLADLKNRPKTRLTIVFGKNNDDLFKSINEEDLEFLRTLPNLELKHEGDLHAKVYMNDSEIILSSMNLYEYSQHNNIEFGVYGTAKGIISSLSSSITGSTSFDQEAVKYFWSVVKNARLIIDIEPQFEKGRVFSADKYKNSITKVDELASRKTSPKKSSSNQAAKMGYCIRTGMSIPFNVKMPFSDKSFKSWERFGDENYPEKYCHFSGESSDGETCFSRPILKKNWKKAMSN
ncbi:phospholipase D family protein [Croceimicrobium hydrocarbonivorans]|uniref:Phospholipase D family protein n=1 Tax=Croceimicrobium hydrocarbonivorans TaxID=2761580 RepID=A0A7H0VF33_9FLAO|nr:phospholipase D family protein [Croceimicrobium hydrocarbonivorans]QNR24331.1 phospholipase D family protein [Croceimicrobium hydrocarbonivorans]